jgi:hypothetical protein
VIFSAALAACPLAVNVFYGILCAQGNIIFDTAVEVVLQILGDNPVEAPTLLCFLFLPSRGYWKPALNFIHLPNNTVIHRESEFRAISSFANTPIPACDLIKLFLA